MPALISAAVALLLCLAAGSWLLRPGSRLYWLDEPNERSLHRVPVPRTGGIAILAGVAAGWVVGIGQTGAPPGWVGLVGGACLVAGVSLLDDYRGVGVATRLAVQSLAAAALLLSPFLAGTLHLDTGWFVLPAWLASVLAFLFVVWMVNLYNFMDGMDGFSGGMAVFGFGFMAWLGWLADAVPFAVLSLAVAASALGFLRFNFPPARMFMGDAGASTLGFLAAGLILWAHQAGVFPLWAGLLIFSPFIVDATVTLLLGLLAGERVWLPHRRHFYQRLVGQGWSHRRTVLWEYLLMFAAGSTAIGLSQTGDQALVHWVLGAWGWLYVIIILWILAVIRR